MRISDLRYAGVPAWPPAWTSALPESKFLARKVQAILMAVRGRGAGDIEVSIDGESYQGLLLWDGQPSREEVVRTLQAFVGRPLSDAAGAVIRSTETRRSA